MADFRIRFGKQQPSFASARPRLLGLSIHLRLTVFIVPITKGAFSLKKRHGTEWRLTEFPCDVTHAISTKDFMRWQPGARNSERGTGSGTVGTRNGTERYL